MRKMEFQSKLEIGTISNSKLSQFQANLFNFKQKKNSLISGQISKISGKLVKFQEKLDKYWAKSVKCQAI